MKSFSKNQLQRYPIYLKLFRSLLEMGEVTISSPQIAKELGYSEEQIRKDLQAVSDEPGRPKKGRDLHQLVDTLESFLGYREDTLAILIGVGHLGNALLNYPNFDGMGLSIVAAFDNDPKKIGLKINDKTIYDSKELSERLPELKAKIAIICVPAGVAQEVVDKAIASGAKGIWNFAPTHINVPRGVVIENVNLASSLAVLSHRLNEELSKEG
ncbi:MAG TPA: redox-sensing transcriptional repressor Rex [Firmicutes bacterium]|nr:redox-sensing transcriptional repressor Rex [Bacillota bacterium]